MNRKYENPACLNLSSINIPKEILNIIALGPNFVLPSDNIMIQDILSLYDRTNKFLMINNPTEYHQKHKALMNTILNYQNNYQNHTGENNNQTRLLDLAKTTIQFLNNNQELMIVESDKSNCTVILHQFDYSNMVDDMIKKGLDKNMYKISHINNEGLYLKATERAYLFKINYAQKHKFINGNQFDTNRALSMSKNYNNRIPLMHPI